MASVLIITIAAAKYEIHSNGLNDREKIPFVVVVGEEEIKSGKFKVKNLRESKEQEVSREGIGEFIKI